jgi:hypothetical protein
VESLIAWCGFAGAWLLFGGPVYQAALELQEQDIERDRMAELGEMVEGPPPVSRWWWLLPPVWYALERRRRKRWRNAVLAAMAPSELAALVNYVDKATAWLFVGLGGLLIATKETWELVEHYEWPVYVFWIVVAAMLVIASANANLRLARSRSVLATPASHSLPAPSAALEQDRPRTADDL